MCGIAGIVDPQAGNPSLAHPHPNEIRAMIRAIAHRGPDGEGFFEAPGIAFGHCRLTIIDLSSAGAQPMSDAAARVWVTYNGEIYNFRPLRAELEAKGCVFRTQCDTEVLVHGYRIWGEELLSRLNGMFAFALWDADRRRLFAARDRMGQKPFFYAQLADGRLLFASEAKALMAHSGLRPEVDDAGLAAYLTFEYLPGELSMFRGVKKLPPAHALVYAEGRLSIRPYWDLPMGETLDGGDPLQRFGELFDRAVESQLMADVPLGIFLSGGIDSSAVAAAAVRVRPPGTVQTFAIGFDDPSYDESAPARAVARHLGTDHHERVFGVDTMREVLPKVVERLDEPFGDASLLPTYLLSAFARESVKVALGGDGSDELLMGYPTFRADAAAQLFRRLPAPLRSAARGLAEYLPVNPGNFSFDFVVRSFLRAADCADAARHPLWLGSAVPGGPDDPLAADLRRCQPLERVLKPALEAYRSAPTRNRLERLSYQYCKTYLAEDILHKVDRASMAVSLEVRSPYLDRDLLEHIARMPAALKRRGGSSKIALRRSCAGRLPAATLARRKKGFGIPIAAWLRGPLSPMLNELLSPERVRRAGYLEPRVVSRLVDEHRAGRRNHRKLLWTLLSFELWRERYAVGARS